MRIQWTLAVLVSAALTVACVDRNADNPQNFEENAATPGTTGQVHSEPGTAEVPSRTEDSSAAPRQAPPAQGDADPAHGFQASPSANTATAPRVQQVREITVPAGTALPLDLMTALSSETAQIETPVKARLRQSLVVDGHTVLPAGAVLNGSVTDVDRAGRVQGRARLSFRFHEVEINGGREDLRTNPLTFQGEASKGEDATKIGAGAVGGAIIGGILGGGDGAAKGAAIGGAAGTGVVLATRGKEVTLASGANLAASLAEPFSVRVPR